MAEPGGLAALSDELAALVEVVIQGVVALSGSGDGFSSSGSGFLIDDDGHVVTNTHVVAGLTGPMTATLHGGGTCQAGIVGTDHLTDLALLRIEGDAPKGHHLQLRERPARPGELCMTIGSPFGIYPESVSLGVVSGVARVIPRGDDRPIWNAVQTDAAVNPGNSGGPLVDVRGEVMGVNQGHDDRGPGIALAIPAETVRWVTAELVQYGKVARAALGVSVVKRALEVEGRQVVGLAVTRATGPAPDDKHGQDGLRVDDVILEVNQQPTDEPGDLYRILTRDLIGKPTSIRVVRQGTVTTLTVQPTELPQGS